jgi:glycerophosphoryl diester phosphodiesterase
MLSKAHLPIKKKNFLVIAHRGASKYAPENTMSAFRLAHKMNADMIELDVQLSKDGIPIVFHDAKLDRHSNGNGFLSSFLFDELRQLDAGEWFSIEYQGEKIPSLKEVLEWAAGKILVNIEIKTEAVHNSAEDGVEEKVIQLVENTKMEKNVIISSFDYRTVKRIKKMAPEILTGLLYNKKSSVKRGPVELMKEYGADFFHCSKSEMNKKWIAQLNDAEKRYLIYTINNKRQMKQWLENGSFGIFSDKPDLLREVTDRYLSESA